MRPISPVDISALTEEQLREVGAAWTSALVRKARDRKGDAVARLNRTLERQRNGEDE